MFTRVLRFSLFFICVTTILKAQQPVKDKNFHLYILMGQSNMAGRGPLTESLKQLQNNRVYVLDKNNEWKIAKHPLHFDKPTMAAAGPGLSFGIKMAEQDTSIRIGLIPCAVGGTSINKWAPGVLDNVTQTHPYDDAVLRIKEAMKYGVIKGMIWHQGEADSKSKCEEYSGKFKELTDRVRKLTKNKKLPIVAGELGHFKEQYILMNKCLSRLPLTVKKMDVVTAENLKDKGDLTHFDGASANEYGKRYADAMLKLQGKE